ncbi:MAG: choice-of-anchor J domain-containing protein [Bacteroidaceae bacterium]|nr:choice-of-anchor J domain-containing protein [Bacteroidaceae bacterium]
MKRTLISVLLILTALYMSAGSVTPPQDLVTDTYYADAHCFYIEPTGIPLYYKVEIGFQDNDVYIKGLFPVCPNDWVKGTIRDNEVIIDHNQSSGTFNDVDIYPCGSGGQPVDFIFSYTPETSTLKGSTLIATKSPQELSRVFVLSDIIISKETQGEAVATTGDPVNNTPYTNPFETFNDYHKFGIINSNNDFYTWAFSNAKGASYMANKDVKADDWLVSPAIKLIKDKEYCLSLDAYASAPIFPERIEVMMGTSPMASAMTQAIIPATVVKSEETVTLENGSFTVSETGYYHFGIHVISDPDAQWLLVENFSIVPLDYLSAPSQVENLTVDTTRHALLSIISFNAPLTNIGGNPLSDGLDSLQLFRDGKPIHTFLPSTDNSLIDPGTEFRFIDCDPALTIGMHSYQVLPYNSFGAGKMSDSKDVILTTVLTVPFITSIDLEDYYSIFEIIDANQDDCTWEYTDFYGYLYNYSDINDADDYLVLSSPVHLETGRYYRFEVDAQCSMSDYPEMFMLKIGKEPSVQGLNIITRDTTIVTNEDFVTYGQDFEVTESGDYYLAVHAVSEADMYGLYINRFCITEGASLDTPSGVTDFSATAGPKGALCTTISFKAPLTAKNGQDLTGSLYVQIMRDGELIHTVENIQPGAQINWTDQSVPAYGTYKYQVMTGNVSGYGIKSDIESIFVGLDIPRIIPEFVVSDDPLLFLSWSISDVGAKGGYVDTTDVDYVIWEAEYLNLGFSSQYRLIAPIDTVHNQTYAIIRFNTKTGKQGLKYIAVKPANSVGTGDHVVFIFWAGQPYTLPFHESFENNELTYSWDYGDGYFDLYFTRNASDKDNAALGLSLSPYAKEQQSALWTGVIDMENADNPILVFDLSSKAVDSRMQIIGYDSINTLMTLLDIPATISEYTTYYVELKDAWDKGMDRIGFNFIYNDRNDIHYLDNIRIFDAFEYDLCAELTTDNTITEGDSLLIKAAVFNNGTKPARDYTLTLTIDGREILSNTYYDELPPFSRQTVEIKIPTSVLDSNDYMIVRADVEYDYDLDTDNNMNEEAVSVLRAKATAPYGLTAILNGNDVVLDWQVKNTASAVFFETFTGYPVGSCETGQVGEWTLVNGNGKPKGEILEDTSLPLDGKALAWMVFNALDYDFYSETFYGPDGQSNHTYLISPCNYVSNQYYDNDDWIISPLLSGQAQEISFWVKSVGNHSSSGLCQVLYSETDTAIAHFTPITTMEQNDVWQQMTVLLPQGARYFAIRNLTAGNSAICMLISDIKYIKDIGQPVGYNIYVDGVRIGASDSKGFVVNADALSKENHQFAVTAVYSNGTESGPVTVGLDISTDIRLIPGNGKPFDIYSTDGKLIRSNALDTEGLEGLFIIDGNKILINGK